MLILDKSKFERELSCRLHLDDIKLLSANDAAILGRTVTYDGESYSYHEDLVSIKSVQDSTVSMQLLNVELVRTFDEHAIHTQTCNCTTISFLKADRSDDVCTYCWTMS